MSVRIGRLEGGVVRVIGEMPGPSCLLLCRADYDVCSVEVPARLPDRELEAAVRFRLREVYPGQEESSLLDMSAVRSGDSLRVLVSVVRAEVMERYRDAAEGSPVVPAHRLLKPRALRRPVAFLGPDWVELWLEGPGGAIESRLLRREAPAPEEGPAEWLREQLGDGSACLLLGDPRDLPEADRSAANGHAARLVRRSIRPRPFTRPPRPQAGPRRILDVVLGAALLGSAAFAALDAVAERKKELARLKTSLAAIEVSAADYQRLRAELSRRQTISDDKDAARLARLLSELAGSLPADTELTRIEYDAPLFKAEGSSTGPLLIPGLLARREGFSGITVGSVVQRQEAPGFRFVLSGEYR